MYVHAFIVHVYFVKCTPAQLHSLITLRTCARDQVISSVVVIIGIVNKRNRLISTSRHLSD